MKRVHSDSARRKTSSDALTRIPGVVGSGLEGPKTRSRRRRVWTAAHQATGRNFRYDALGDILMKNCEIKLVQTTLDAARAGERNEPKNVGEWRKWAALAAGERAMSGG